MNCNCVNVVEENIKDLHQPRVKAPIDSVLCQNISFVLGGPNSGSYISIPFRVKADAPGYRSEKGREFSVMASYCPFCGVSTRKQTGGANAQEKAEA